MKTIQILCLGALLSFAVGCKKETTTETTVEQTEMGTLPDATATDTVAPVVPDSVATDTMAAPQ